MRATLLCLMYCVIVGGGALLTSAATDAGQFIPKAFYTVDAQGHPSELHPINEHVAQYLRRVRRQSSSSSSSSSSVSVSDGGPTFFTSQQSVQHTPEVPAVGIASRFGGGTSGTTGTTGGTTGHIIQTTGVIDKTGRVTYTTRQGHF